MKKILVALTMTICLIFVSAQARAEGLSITAYSQVWGKYLGGNGGIFYDKPVHQSRTTVCYRGFCGDIWGSYSLDGRNGFGKEVDFTGWYGNDWAEIGVAYFALWPKGFSDVVQPFLKLKHQFTVGKHEFIPYGKLELYWPVSGSIPQHGAIFAAGLAHTWHLMAVLDFNHEPTLKYDNGAFGNNSAVIGQYKADLSWKLNKNLTVQLPMLKASTPLTKVRDGRKTEYVVGVGAVFAFNWSDLAK